MKPTARLAWLFDIDGTLLTTDGAAREAFSYAVRDVLQSEYQLEDVVFAGRTDPLILRDILRKRRIGLRPGDEARFWNAVFDSTRELLLPGRGRLLPGVTDLLDAIAREPGWVMGLLTGNMTEMARIKLSHFGLEDRFAFGAFGEQASDRDALACGVVGRVGREWGVPARRCIVVGDTEHDVACARAAGAHVVAVATGSRSLDALASLDPDRLVPDLTDTPALIAWARGIAAGA